MKVLIFVVVSVVGVVGLFIVFGGSSEDTVPNAPTPIRTDTTAQTAQTTPEADAPERPRLYIGDPSAPVKIVEYIDFKCPSCNRHHQTVSKEIISTYVDTNQVAIEIRNFPFIGPDSGRAARGSYCAQERGVFQQYHDDVLDYLWGNFYESGNLAAEFQDILTADVLGQIMSPHIDDTAAFQTCLEDTSWNAFIDEDLLAGADDSINGTPGFVVAGQSLIGPQTFSTFETLIRVAERTGGAR